jgi:Raf kinase inhibitor-like YbhB/YbcL family protein
MSDFECTRDRSQTGVFEPRFTSSRAITPFLAIVAGTVVGCRPPTDVAHPPAASSSAAEQSDRKGEKTMAIKMSSGAFEAGQPIPKLYTGDGDDRSPPLSWNGVPTGTKEFALICDDPDAPTPKPWVHWVIYKIPAQTKSLEEGVPRQPEPPTPKGALQGVNSFPSDNIGYRGPAPPKGHGTHHYHFKLYALDAPLNLKAALDKEAVLAAMKGHILGEGEIIGTYER